MPEAITVQIIMLAGTIGAAVLGIWGQRRVRQASVTETITSSARQMLGELRTELDEAKEQIETLRIRSIELENQQERLDLGFQILTIQLVKANIEPVINYDQIMSPQNTIASIRHRMNQLITPDL